MGAGLGVALENPQKRDILTHVVTVKNRIVSAVIEASLAPLVYPR